MEREVYSLYIREYDYPTERLKRLFAEGWHLQGMIGGYAWFTRDVLAEPSSPAHSTPSLDNERAPTGVQCLQTQQ